MKNSDLKYTLKFEYYSKILNAEIRNDVFNDAINYIDREYPAMIANIPEGLITAYDKTVLDIFDTGYFFFNKWFSKHKNLIHYEKSDDIAAYIICSFDPQKDISDLTPRAKGISNLSSPIKVCTEVMKRNKIFDLNNDMFQHFCINIFLFGISSARQRNTLDDYSHLKCIILNNPDTAVLRVPDGIAEFAFDLPQGLITHMKNDYELKYYYDFKQKTEDTKNRVHEKFNAYYKSKVCLNNFPANEIMSLDK